MCSAFRFCFSVYLPLSPRGMMSSLSGLAWPGDTRSACNGGANRGGRRLRAGVGAGTGAATATPPARDDTPTVVVVPTSPGTVLAHRLHRAGLSPGCQLGCAVAFAAIWNGIVGVFEWRLVAQWNQGGAFRWRDALFLIPFVIVGLLLIVFVLAAAVHWFVSRLAGRVDVELSAHPVAPGAAVRVRVAQRGLAPLRRVSVAFVCTEQATYVAGTSKSTAKREVAEHPVRDPEADPDGGGLPLEAEFAAPADAMHTFVAPNHQIAWTVRGAGRVP